MRYEERKKDKKERTIPLASVVSAEAIMSFSLMSFFINQYNVQLICLLALNSGAFVTRIQILLRSCARCLIRAQPVFEGVFA